MTTQERQLALLGNHYQLMETLRTSPSTEGQTPSNRPLQEVVAELLQ